MSDKPFAEGVAELKALVGVGLLIGSVAVDQVYAQNQHESVWFRHPHGGKAMFLHDPLMEGYNEWLQWIAEDLLEVGPVDAMREAMDELVQGVYDQAPVEFDNLRRSGAAKVTDDGSTVYNRPAEVGRLSKQQLRVEGRLSETFSDRLSHRPEQAKYSSRKGRYL
jgi:hypothetical protein